MAMLLFAMLAPVAETRAFDTAMICAWQRTFHIYNYIDSPLRVYSMPRRSNCGCWGWQAGSETAFQGPVAYESPGLERLGRIPNDSVLGGAAPIAAPGR